LAAFDSGLIDGLAGLTPHDLGNLSRPHNLTINTYPNYFAVFINASQNPALQESAVRQALDMSINKDEITRKILGDYGKVSGGPSAAYLGIKATSTYTLEASRELLEDAGWALNNTGKRFKQLKNGQLYLSVELTVPAVDYLEETAKLLSDYWTQLGVETKIRTLTTEDAISQSITNRDYELILFGNVISPAEDLFPFWHSSQTLFPGLNLSLYNNKQADEILSSIRIAEDSILFNSKLEQLNSIILNDIPAIFLFENKLLFATSKNLKGLREEVLKDPADYLQNVSAWYIKTTRVFK